MGKLTMYKVKAFVYDLYVKCNDKKNGEKINFKIRDLVKYHHIGNHIETALWHFNLITRIGNTYVWNKGEPNEEFIEMINNKKSEIDASSNKRMKNKLMQNTIDKVDKTNTNNNDEINQYKDALEKALLRINELERKETFKNAEVKKSGVPSIAKPGMSKIMFSAQPSGTKGGKPPKHAGKICSAKSLWRWVKYRGINPHHKHIHLSFKPNQPGHKFDTDIHILSYDT